MKKTKKVISLLIALAFILSAFPMPVAFAEGEEYEAISLDETVIISSEDELGATRYFSFTAQEDGRYVFSSFDNDDLDVRCYIYDSDMNEIAYDDDGAGYPNFKSSFDLTAGDTVYLLSEPLSSGDEGSYSVKVVKVITATEITISNESITGTIMETKSLSASLLPENAEGEEISWKTSDSTIFVIGEIYNDGKGCDISLLSEGTATITASTESGLTATCEIIVEEPPLIEAESTVIITATEENSGVELFKFVPVESGKYKFYSHDNDFDTYGHIYDSDLNQIYYNDDGGDGSNFYIEFDAVVGEVYYLKARSYYEETSGGFSISVNKLVSATSLELSAESISGKVGSIWDMSGSLIPENAKEEQITWSSSDEDVVKIIYNSNSECQLRLMGAGAATVTATSENGLTDSCAITVDEPVEIEAGETVQLECSDEEYKETYIFVPQATGLYKFEENINGASYSLNLYNSVFEWLSSDSYMQVELTAGETYYYTVNAEKSEDAEFIDFSLVINHLVPATGITLSQETVIGELATYETINVNFLPENAIKEEITWEIDNEDVAIIYSTWNEGEYCELKFVGPGTAVITATTENGLTASCEITVDDPVEIVLGETSTVYADEYAEEAYSYAYSFVPEESGTYSFDFTTNNSYIDWIVVYNGDLEFVGKPSGDFQLELTAGETYYFIPNAEVDYREDEGNESYISLCVNKAEQATAITLSKEEVKSSLGVQTYIKANFLPENAINESITWSSSDEKIVVFSETGYNDDCLVKSVGVGKATITATTESGLTASCEIIVENPVEIKSGETKEVKSWDEESCVTYKFVSETDGRYRIENNVLGFSSYSTAFYNDEFESVYGWVNNSVELSAGETYYYVVSDIIKDNADEYVTINLSINKLSAATDINLNKEHIKGSLGGYVSIQAEFSPENAIEEEITWTSSVESVVIVSDTWNNTKQCSIKCVGAGEATITATTESGLTATCQITVDESIEITSGETYTVYADDGYSHTYSFTPEADGTYLFDFSYQNVYVESFNVYDADLEWLDECLGDFQIELTGGKTYYFVLRGEEGYYDESDESYISLLVSKLVPATEITLPEAITGKVGKGLTVEAEFAPDAIKENVYWHSSDESVVSIDSEYYAYNTEAFLEFLKVGTAVITATTESGLTATCTVSVVMPEEISIGSKAMKRSGNSFKGTDNYFIFIPEEDGIYKFSVSGNNIWDEYVEIWSEDESVYDYGNEVFLELTAGETYFCEATAVVEYSDEPTSAALNIKKVEKATTLELSEVAISGATSQVIRLEADFGPVDCAREYIEWEIADETVAGIDSYSDEGYCLIVLKNAGTTTITATSENGLTATCTITVTEPEEIALNTTKNISDISAFGVASYKFIPEKDGTYVFYSFDNDCDTYGYVFNSDIEEIDHNDDGNEENNFKIKFNAEAGEVYYLSARRYNQASDGGYSICVKEYVEATEIKLTADATQGKPGQKISITQAILPEGAEADVYWDVSDETIIGIWEYFNNEEEGKGCVIELKSEGTATVTARTDNDLSTTCTITVLSVPQIDVGNTALVKGDGEYSADDNVYKFIPEEDGTYNFHFVSENVYDEYIKLWSADGEVSSSSWNGLSCQLEAGETYYCRASAIIDDETEVSSCTLKIEKLAPATSVSISPSQSQLSVGLSLNLEVVFGPEGSAPEEFSWEISDENIFYAQKDDAHGIVVYGTNPGTATITITTSGGLTASATITIAQPEYIALDEIKTLSVTATDRGAQTYAFVPEEDGVYAFCSNCEEIDVYCEIFDSYGDTIAEDDDGGEGLNFFAEFYAEVGETYYLHTTTYSESGTGNYSVTVKKLQDATGLRLSRMSYKGEVLDNFNLQTELIPDNSASEDIIWSISDTSVVEIRDTSDGRAYFRIVGKGNAIITAESESGFTATCVVTAEEPEEITLDRGAKLSYSDGLADKKYTFVPEEDGIYRFNFSGADENGGYTIYPANDFDAYQSNDYGEFALEAGQTYYIDLNFWSQNKNSLQAYDVTVEKCTKATTMTLSQTAVSQKISQYVYLQPVFGPVGCATESVQWESSNEAVAEILYGGKEAEIQIVGAGQATITATSESGMTATCIITGEEAPVVKENAETTMTVNAEKGIAVYKFIPEKTGNLVIYSLESNFTDVEVALFDRDFEWLENSFQYGDAFSLSINVTKGRTYYIMFRANSDEAMGTAKFIISESVAATSINIIEDSLNVSKYDRFNCDYTLMPLNARNEDVTWTTSNPDIVTVDDGHLVFNAVGTATVTVTTESGLTDSCTIIVSEPPMLQVGVKTSVTKEHNTWNKMFRFIPETSGCYTFESFSKCDTYCTLYDADNNKIGFDHDSGDVYNFLITEYLEQGQVYYIRTDAYTYGDDVVEGYDVLVTQNIEGDINRDGEVDVNDYQQLVNLVVSTPDMIEEEYGENMLIIADVNGDGAIDVLDAWKLSLMINQ